MIEQRETCPLIQPALRNSNWFDCSIGLPITNPARSISSSPRLQEPEGTMSQHWTLLDSLLDSSCCDNTTACLVLFTSDTCYHKRLHSRIIRASRDRYTRRRPKRRNSSIHTQLSELFGQTDSLGLEDLLTKFGEQEIKTGLRVSEAFYDFEDLNGKSSRDLSLSCYQHSH